MDNNEKNTQEKFDATMKTVTDAAKTKWGKVAIIVVLLLILLNIVWTLNGKVLSQLDVVKADFGAMKESLEQRIDKAEKGSVDLDAVKADAETIKQATVSFESRLTTLIQAEEARLESMLKEMETQKSYLESLKNLLPK